MEDPEYLKAAASGCNNSSSLTSWRQIFSPSGRRTVHCRSGCARCSRSAGTDDPRLRRPHESAQSSACNPRLRRAYERISSFPIGMRRRDSRARIVTGAREAATSPIYSTNSASHGLERRIRMLWERVLRDQHSVDHPAVCTINSSVNSATSRRSRQSVDGWLKGTLQGHLRETSPLLDPLLCMWKTRNMSSSKNRLRVACLGAPSL